MLFGILIQLAQIFGFLHPLDLLNLARTTKSLRQVTMSRSARPVWRESFETVDDLPKCPEDMSEPEYANLVFDTACSVCSILTIRDNLLIFDTQECLSSRGAEAFWAWRRRLCKKCLRKACVTCYISSLEAHNSAVSSTTPTTFTPMRAKLGYKYESR